MPTYILHIFCGMADNNLDHRLLSVMAWCWLIFDFLPDVNLGLAADIRFLYVSGTCQIRVISIFGTAEMLPILKIGFNCRNICHQLNLVDVAEKASQLSFAVLGSLLVLVADASGRAWYKSNWIHLGFDSMWVGVVLILIYRYMIILDVTRKFQYIHRHHKHSWVHFDFNKYFKHCLLSASVLTIPET